MKTGTLFVLLLAARIATAQPQPATAMQLASPDFRDGEMIPAEFTCDGKNWNPALNWSGIPAAAKSLALIVDDPDAPAGTWTHWLVWNLPPKLTGIVKGTMLEYAVQGRNDFGDARYGGPCPPSGTHRYFFKLYALDARLDLPQGASRKAMEAAMKGHVLATAVLMGRYAKQR